MTEVLTYEALKAERDALEVRLRKALSGEQEAIQRAHAANQTADALAVENAAMRGVIDAAIGVANNSSGIAGWHLNGEIADWDEILPELNIETPATDAAIAAIEARGVEKYADYLASSESPFASLGSARNFAKQLREAK
ncbi:TPA: hypothetical protein ACXJM1_001208 [Serratia marcescens]